MSFSKITVATAVATAMAAVPADKVSTIPGFGTPVSNMYSGYLTAGVNKQHHYVYTESLSAPATDPLVIWFNGGPGCSSMEGAFSESGLYHIQEFTNPPTLMQNPFSWANFSNNLFIESPAAVGYSYCTTRAGCSHTDTSTAQDNLQALLSFFTSYPELSGRDFYITGESYAGIYIPTLAYAIYQNNIKNPSQAIALRGIMVGNGCIGNAAGHCGNDPTGLNDYHDIMIWKGHGLISETAYDAIMAECVWDNESNKCQQLLNEAGNSIGNIDVYYLYNTCSDPALAKRGKRAPTGNSLLGRAIKAAVERAEAAGLGIDPNCFGTGPTLETWFNQAAVKSNFHVAPAIQWSLCSNNGTFNYNSDIADERTLIYPTLTQQAGIQVMIYNGEADLCVPHTDNEWWTRSMNYTVKAPWKSWSVPGAEGAYVGGYRIRYDYNFTFATVRGAGHMVPETRPEAAYELLTSFIKTGTV